MGRNGGGAARQQGQQCGECLGQIPAGHDGINMTMRELPFRRLIVFGGFLHGRLCDDARAGEADGRAGFC